MKIPVRDFDEKIDLPYLNSKILPLRIEVAKKLRKNLLFIQIKELKPFYWSGKISINGYNLDVHFQNYCIRKKLGKVNYVSIYDFNTGKSLNKNQLIEINRKLN